MAAEPLDTRAVYDLGHRGDVDTTQIDKFLALTPTQRWQRYRRWRQFLRPSRAMFNQLEEVIRRLAEQHVEYVVVGGVSAVLQGATVDTFDLDLCYRRTPDNITRLVAALGPLNPRPRGFPPESPFTFDERTIQLGSNFTFDVGGEDLDLLGEMSAIGGYEQIIGQAADLTLADIPVKVLSLEQLIATKEAAGRTKDLAALPNLREALERKQKQAPPPDDLPSTP
jgi:predicted nucleotidyltransferase